MKASTLIVLTVLLLSSGDGGGDPPPIPPSGEDVTELDFSDGHGGCWLQDQEEGAEKFLSAYPNLKFLRLCGEIKEIPFAVFSLKKLEELDARWNQIEKIPKEIGNLVNLKILLLSDNKIKELPESIGHLMNLEELDLSNNNLKTLPSSIVNLINATIDLSFTPLSEKSGFSYLYPKWSRTQKVIDYYDTKVKPYINDFQGLPEAYTVNATNGLSVRNKPKLKAKKIGAMPHKLKIAVYEESSKTETIDGVTAPWMRITALANCQYMEGWAWGGYLEKFVYTE